MNNHPEDSRELVAILNTVFNKLDSNHDGVLQASELDNAVIDAELSDEMAQAVAVLKAGFAEIRELHKEGWFAKKNGITLADLLVFEKLILMDSSSDEAANHRQLLNLTRGVRQRVLEAATMKRRLYHDTRTPLASIRPEAIRQGMVGDCYFLAALGSVVATNPQIILRIIHQDDDHLYTVIFPGARDEAITVQAPGLVELSLYAQITAYGIWPAVLEKAYGQYLIAHGYRKTVIPTDATAAAQHVYEAFDLLTGQMGRWQLLAELDDEALDKSLTSAFREKRASAAATFPSLAGDKDLTADGIPAQHAYSILGWNTKLQRITLRNPWGPADHSEPETAAHLARDNRLDGVFTMNTTELRRNFIAIYYEDWLPDERYE